MTIQTFPGTGVGQAAAFAVPDPKNINFIPGKGFEVRDGVDYVAPPALTQDQIDAAAAKSYAKLAALSAMTPAQVQAWVAANVTNLTQAQDAIATLAVAASVLVRRL
jgi:acyl-CoA reductase-like NAD-dependent aldehyde dehydrogenase